MPDASDQHLLEALLDSWERNNTILVNLLRALPEARLKPGRWKGSPSVAEMFTHIHYRERLFTLLAAPVAAQIKQPSYCNLTSLYRWTSIHTRLRS